MRKLKDLSLHRLWAELEAHEALGGRVIEEANIREIHNIETPECLKAFCAVMDYRDVILTEIKLKEAGL